MALKIYWTPQAEKGLEKVIEYLQENWTINEILRLEERILQVTRQIIVYPTLYPKSIKYKKLHKAIIDKNNYLVYRLNKKANSIEIINFRGTKQNPKH